MLQHTRLKASALPLGRSKRQPEDGSFIGVLQGLRPHSKEPFRGLGSAQAVADEMDVTVTHIACCVVGEDCCPPSTHSRPNYHCTRCRHNASSTRQHRLLITGGAKCDTRPLVRLTPASRAAVRFVRAACSVLKAFLWDFRPPRKPDASPCFESAS